MLDAIQIIGFGAAALATIAFLPQMIKTVQTKETKAISLPMYLLFCTGVSLWLIYGLFTRDWPIIIGNIVTLLLASIVFSYKLRNRIKLGEK
jgi:MtN3 and saliva related transmembrane protein